MERPRYLGGADWPPSLWRTGLQPQLTEVRYGAGTCPRYLGQADLHLQGELAFVPTGDWPPSLRGTGLHPYGVLASVPKGDWPPSLRGTGLQRQLAKVRYGAGALADRAARDRERGGGGGHHQAVAPALTLQHRGRIFKLLIRSPSIDSRKPIPAGYVAWRAGTTALFLLSSEPH
jgi:hypothetical protein